MALSDMFPVLICFASGNKTSNFYFPFQFFGCSRACPPILYNDYWKHQSALLNFTLKVISRNILIRNTGDSLCILITLISANILS
jgi:hypothetical protein